MTIKWRYSGMFLIVSILMLCILGLGSQWFNPFLQFDRASVNEGEWWRILTAHFVHLNGYHLLLNIIGFMVCFILFGSMLTQVVWVLALVWSPLFVGLALYFFSPEVEHYVGFSGLLYGLYFLGLILCWKKARLLHSLILATLIWRLYTERHFSDVTDYWYGYMNINVLVDAHVYGAFCGVSFAVMILILPIRYVHNT